MANHPDPKIKESVPVLTVGSGIRWAYGFSDLVGMNASMDFAYGETYIRGVNGLAFIAGTGIDLDFYPRFSVPIGFIANYNITSQPEFVYVNDSFAHVMKAKLAYTKASDFSLGLEYSLMIVPMPNVDKSPLVYTFALSSRFYFKFPMYRK